MNDRIDTKTGRARLSFRREPHWHRLGTGKHLGFRKIGPGIGTWFAKYRDPATRERAYRALGDVTDALAFDQAKSAAERWFTDVERGTSFIRSGKAGAARS